MNASTLRRIIDAFHATSAQQWSFRVVAVASALGAVLAAVAANERLWPAGLFIVAVLAIASALRPDDQTALVVVVVVIWHWLATVDDVGTPWLPAAAVCLLVLHTLIALSASIPIGGLVPRDTIGRWATMTTLAACAMFILWLFVVVLDDRDAGGNGLLTALALAIVAGAAIMIRSRSLDTLHPRT